MRSIILLLIVLPIVFFGQLSAEDENQIVELKKTINSNVHDSLKIRALIQWDDIIYFNDPIADSTILEQIIFICKSNLKEDLNAKEKRFFTAELAKGLNYLGASLTGLDYYNSAIERFEEAILIYEKANIVNGLDGCIINSANAYYYDGQISQAIIQYNKGIKMTDKSGNLRFRSNALMALGNIYLDLNQVDKSLEYLHKSINVTLELEEESHGTLGTNYLNLGNAYLAKNDLDSSLSCYLTSVAFCKKIGDTYAISTTYHNLGEVYLKRNNMDSSLYYYKEGMKMREELNLQSNLVYSYAGLCSWNTKQKNSKKAVEWGEKAIEQANKYNALIIYTTAANALYKAYKLDGQYEKSLDTYLKLEEARDSIQSKSNQKELLNQEIRYIYETNKIVDSLAFIKQKQIDDIARVKDKEKEAQEKYILYGSLGFAIILFGLAFIGYRRKNNDHKIISEQKRKADFQREEIEEAHREITDSINYAERIQKSFLASEELLTSHIPQHFVYFNPKEAVSGDFYWASQLHNGNFSICCADSTGHGVPGAIMSILNIFSLEKSIELKLTNPSDIFNNTRKLIIERLKSDGSAEGGKDGMDATLLSFNPEKTLMNYVSANNPIWIIRQGEIIEIKGEKMPVGKHDKDHIPFKGGDIEIHKGDQIYALTDGFQDQFGGPKGKKFMVKNMREFILKNSHLSMNDQHQQIKDIFTNWKGDIEQIDDVCIIGIRI